MGKFHSLANIYFRRKFVAKMILSVFIVKLETGDEIFQIFQTPFDTKSFNVPKNHYLRVARCLSQFFYESVAYNQTVSSFNEVLVKGEEHHKVDTHTSL